MIGRTSLETFIILAAYSLQVSYSGTNKYIRLAFIVLKFSPGCSWRCPKLLEIGIAIFLSFHGPLCVVPKSNCYHEEVESDVWLGDMTISHGYQTVDDRPVTNIWGSFYRRWDKRFLILMSHWYSSDGGIRGSLLSWATDTRRRRGCLNVYQWITGGSSFGSRGTFGCGSGGCGSCCRPREFGSSTEYCAGNYLS